MSTFPMIIRDPVHNIIEIHKEEQILIDLINSKEFQRLRRIKQLGFNELVFPAANHNRFVHSIGVMNFARKFLNRLDDLEIGCCEEQRLTVLIAALLHDIGHGPFSHAFEKITGENHEDRTREIITKDTKVNEVLRSYNSDYGLDLPAILDSIFDKNSENVLEIEPYLTQIISSQFDADRFDYLLRDSKRTGAKYGEFDAEWLINHTEYDTESKRFYVDKKSLYACEQYIFARYHMYISVYFHKTVRSAEVLFKLLVNRFKELVEEGTIKKNSQFEDYIINAFSGEKIPLIEFLVLDDSSIHQFFRCCEKHNDEILKNLSSRILHRKLYKSIDITVKPIVGITQPQEMKILQEINNIVKIPDYDLIFDDPKDTPYKLYSHDDPSVTPIFVQTINGIKEISEISQLVKNLQTYSLYRCYFPEIYRDNILKIYNEVLNGGQ